MRQPLIRRAARQWAHDWGALVGAGLMFSCVLLALSPDISALIRGQGTVTDGVTATPSIPKDFASAVYYPTRAFVEGVCPYDAARYVPRFPTPAPASPYLPGTLLLHLPFGLMGPDVSALVYKAVSIGLTLMLAYSALRLNAVRVSGAAVLLIASLIVLSRPGRMNLILGQVTLQFVLAGYVALAFARGRPWVSALGLAVCMFKPTFGVPLGLLLLAQGHRRPVLFGAAAVAIINLPLLVVLSDQAGGATPLAKHLMQTALGMQAVTSNDPSLSAARVDGVALMSRLWGRPLSPVAQVLTGGAVLSLAALALRSRLVRGSDSYPGLSSGIIGSAVLLSVYHQAYDLLFLTLPFVALVYGRLPQPIHAPAVRLPLLALFTFLAMNYAVGASVLSRFGLVVESGGHQAIMREPVAVILTSLNGLALLAVFVAYVTIALRSWVLTPSPRYPNSVPSSSRF